MQRAIHVFVWACCVYFFPARAQLFTFDFDERSVRPSHVQGGINVSDLTFPGATEVAFALDSGNDYSLEIVSSEPFTSAFNIYVNPAGGRRLNLNSLSFEHRSVQESVWGFSLLVTYFDGSFDFVEVARESAGQDWATFQLDLSSQSAYQDVTSVTLPFEAGGPMYLDNIRLDAFVEVPEARHIAVLAGGACLGWAALVRRRKRVERLVI